MLNLAVEAKIFGCLMYNIMPPSINANLNLHCETNKDYKSNATSLLNSEDRKFQMCPDDYVFGTFFTCISLTTTLTHLNK